AGLADHLAFEQALIGNGRAVVPGNRKVGVQGSCFAALHATPAKGAGVLGEVYFRIAAGASCQHRFRAGTNTVATGGASSQKGGFGERPGWTNRRRGCGRGAATAKQECAFVLIHCRHTLSLFSALGPTLGLDSTQQTAMTQPQT